MILLGVVAAITLQSTGIVNPDFSQGMTGWARATYGAEPTVKIETTQAHGNALYISADAETDSAFGQDIRVTPGALYRLTGWVKTKAAKPGNAPVFGTIQAQRPGGASVLAT